MGRVTPALLSLAFLVLLAVASLPAGAARSVGYVPYWTITGYHPEPGVFTDIIFFSAPVNSDGSLDLSKVRQYAGEIQRVKQECGGCRLILALTIFDKDVADKVLAYHREELAVNIRSAVLTYGFDGVNLDWEFIRDTNRYTGRDNTDYIIDLLERLQELGITASITSAGSVERVWRDSRLAGLVEYVFLMGYDYHWAGAPETGPVSPLLYSGLDVADSLSILDDYYPREKIVLGMPLYGYDWPASSCEPFADTLGRGKARTLSQILNDYARYGVEWYAPARVPYITYYSSGQCRQIWFDNITSLTVKADYAILNGYGGIGFWALGYERGSGVEQLLYDMVKSRVNGSWIAKIRVIASGDTIEIVGENLHYVESVTVTITLSGQPEIETYQPGELGGEFDTLDVEIQGSTLTVTLQASPSLPGLGVTGSGTLAIITLTSQATVEEASAQASATRYNPDLQRVTVPATVGQVIVEQEEPPGGGDNTSTSPGSPGRTPPSRTFEPPFPLPGNPQFLSANILGTAIVVALVLVAVFLLFRSLRF